MLSIGNLTFSSSLVLSPLSGISDLPFRLINRPFGCGLAFTEMLGASALANKNKSTLKKLSTAVNDRPLGVQILGGGSEIIKRALETVSEYDFDLLDFNAACPVKKVASRGKGAGLLRELSKLQELLKVIVANTDVPVTVKIRTGWDETSVNAVEAAISAEDAGVSGLFIHGRTRSQRYSGNVDYEVIREVKEALKIPVIASGDALSPVLIKKLFDETGSDGVAIARGALGNPWIFSETSEYLKSGTMLSRPDIHDIVIIMKEHLTSNIEFHGEKLGVILFRKFFGWYTRGMSIKELKSRAFCADTAEDMLKLIDEVEEVAHLPGLTGESEIQQYFR